MEQSTVLVTRRGGVLRDSAVAYRIMVDGEPVGKVRPGRTLRVPVRSGAHTVQVKVNTAGSEKYRFNASPGREYAFAVMPNGSALTVFTRSLSLNYVLLSPAPDVGGDWVQEIDRSPIVSDRALLYGGVVPGLLGAFGGLFGSSAGQRLFGVALGLLATLLWTSLVRSGRLLSKRRNTPPPLWHNAVRLVAILLAALAGALALAPGSPPLAFGVGLFLSYYVIAAIGAVYVQKWYRSARR